MSRRIAANPNCAAQRNDPAHYRWISYRSTAPGQAGATISPHPVYLGMGSAGPKWQSADRALFRSRQNEIAIADVGQVLNPSQTLGD